MDRLTMLEKAERLAYEQIDICSALSDARYAVLQKLPEGDAVEQLAHEFLQEAFTYAFGK